MNKKRPILHYPQLDTVLMVEQAIRTQSGRYTKRQLWERLPRKVMYQTFCVILDYLAASGKIAKDSEGTLAWIWDPEGVRSLMEKKHLFWKEVYV